MPTLRIIHVWVYHFDQLSEQAQEKALEKLWNLNVDHDWWECIYEDAENVGIKITEFDLDRNTINGKLTENPLEAFKLVRQNHGKDCETFKTAKDYLAEYIQAFIKWRDDRIAKDILENGCAFRDWSNVDWLREFAYEDEAGELSEDYRHSILEDYLIMLRKEYEYLTSREQVIETIEAIGYQFYEDGTLVRL